MVREGGVRKESKGDNKRGRHGSREREREREEEDV